MLNTSTCSNSFSFPLLFNSEATYDTSWIPFSANVENLVNVLRLRYFFFFFPKQVILLHLTVFFNAIVACINIYKQTNFQDNSLDK